ncbi:MAG TPA: hypothetical protein VNE41_01625 [Chitinophagaceae bacterium]|nr:hypothetical protein [Chitinophagaceae bacterium]
MKYHLLLFFILIGFVGGVSGQGNSLGVFTQHSDIGSPAIAGSSSYDENSQTYTLTGSGSNIWFNEDQFQYCFNQMGGNFILTADFAFVGDSGDPHRKIGWMIRESTDSQSAHISAVSHLSGLTVLQWRVLRGAYMRDPQDEIRAAKRHYLVLQLEREGKLITMRAAHPGEPLQTIGSHYMADMPDSVLAGLFICAHDPKALAKALIWNVRIDQPAKVVPVSPRPPELGSRMEIMNVFTGVRKVIYEQPGRFEAPNWMPGGKRLLFNQQGALYTISDTGGQPEKLNTGFAARINNDHGISFDGKMLAISNSRAGMPEGGSTVYVLPLHGGTPRLMTEMTPSYFHGWSPDGKHFLFVGKQGGHVFNLYRESVNGKKIFPLTADTVGHVDGPEYSPDGKYIYYNGNQSGTMQIWRMNPDGSGKEQLTFDQYNNWFPHLSPDGKWMVFLSYPDHVDPAGHPAYKRVMIRLMPVQGGDPRVIAYLYGGQGTMNVPCWSPDNRHIAFVSNSGGLTVTRERK